MNISGIYPYNLTAKYPQENREDTQMDEALMMERQRDYLENRQGPRPLPIPCACCGENIHDHEWAYKMPDGWWCEDCIEDAKHSTDTIDE